MEAGEQSILFLNRRGASRMVTCGECGEVPTCPRCSVHLTYHSANGRLMCHYCGHSEPLPDACPSCGGALNFLGYGTQKVEEELHAAFPGREILRMDTDTVSATQSHEKLLSRFEKERIPVLVGTQMVAKGLDFENVTLVGVISADLSLYVDDYRAGERTFSLLTQVVGRAGRGAKQGRAVIQTFTPENDVIRCAARRSVHLTYHSANGRLMCHYCGHSEPLPDACPSCGGALNFLGYGTQKVEEELHAAFPGREILRMDTDTVSATQSHEKLLSRFEKERIPVLVGTQMVAKGLDFENVTLVGVISADLSLYVDDYRAGERTFSLLTQVVGRAGRGAKQGRAVIQTFTPENDVIRCAARQDYDSFYEQEIELRRMRLCPPFRELFVLTASGPLESAVLRTCMRLRRSLEGWLAQPPFRDWELTVLGPAPASVAKINDRYRYRLTLAAQNTKEIRAMVAHLVRCAQTDKENKGVSVSADVNPLD